MKKPEAKISIFPLSLTCNFFEIGHPLADTARNRTLLVDGHGRVRVKM